MNNHILIVEDDADLRTLIADLLSLEGYEVETAPDGQAGLEQTLSRPPQLIISDVNMPRLNGHEMLTALRANEATADIPVLLLTANSTRTDQRTGMSLGADDYLTKPFDTSELMEAVASRLARQAAQSARMAQTVDHLKRQMSTSVPHELRTPLTALSASVELLQQAWRTLPPGEVDMILRDLSQANQRLVRIVENHHLYTSLQARPLDPHRPARCDPSEVGQEAADRLAHLHGRADDLEYLFLPAQVALSADHFAKVIEELVDNALKFSAAGSQVRLNGYSKAGAYIIQITDHGRGMPADVLRHLGDFAQPDRARHEQQGIGMGLAIVRLLTEQIGGRLQVTSTPSEGTTIRLELTQPPQMGAPLSTEA